MSFNVVDGIAVTHEDTVDLQSHTIDAYIREQITEEPQLFNTCSEINVDRRCSFKEILNRAFAELSWCREIYDFWCRNQKVIRRQKQVGCQYHTISAKDTIWWPHIKNKADQVNNLSKCHAHPQLSEEEILSEVSDQDFM